MYFKKISVKKRLYIGFGSIAVLVGLSSAIFGWLLRDIHAATNQVVDIRYPRIAISKKVYDSINVQAVMLRNAVIATSVGKPEQASEFLSAMSSAGVANSSYVKELGLTEYSEAETELLKKLREAQIAYARSSDEAVQQLQKGKAAIVGSLILGDLGEKQMDLFKIIGEIIDFQENLMQGNGSDAKHKITNSLSITLGTTSIVLVLSMLMSYVISRSLTSELGGEPADAREVASRIAEGDLAHSLGDKYNDANSLFGALGVMQKALRKTVESVRQSSEAVASAAAQIAQGNLDLSNRTEEQASAVEEIAATMEQLSETVHLSAKNAKLASELALVGSNTATRGGEVINKVVATMNGINESSRKVGDIIGVIDGIAFQTNILALNAAIEAARAGESGRGFAVVADEVRGLAKRSAEAANEIKHLISHNVERVEQGSIEVNEAGETMIEIVDAIRQVNDMFANISQAMHQQSQDIGQILQTMEKMDQVTQQNAALVEECAAAADSLSGQAQQLLTTVSFFQLEKVSDAQEMSVHHLNFNSEGYED